MRRDDAIAALRAMKHELDAFKIVRIGVFGSTARDMAGPDSDIDILVEFEGAPSYFRLAELEAALEARLGRPIDIFTPGLVHPLLRDRIHAEAVYA
ncbi:MAG: nucleotidyltransferase family protein [Alphaproteobacteria bacterium]|jgi:predicted nucleotidyltransferase